MCSPGPRGQGWSESGAELGAQGREPVGGAVFGAPASGIGIKWFSSCRWVFHFQRALLLGRVAGLAPQHGPLQTPLSPARALADAWGGAVPRSLPLPPPLTPPALSVPLSFSSPFLPFLPQGHKGKFPLPSERWQGPRSPAVRGAQPPRPPGGVLAAALSMWPWGTCPLPAGSPAPTDFGVDVSF